MNRLSDSIRSLLHGMSSVFNIRGRTYESYVTEDAIEADRAAIQKDWEAVGNDLHETIRTVTK